MTKCNHSAQDWYIRGDGTQGCDECDEPEPTLKAEKDLAQATGPELAARVAKLEKQVNLLIKVTSHVVKR